MIGLLRGTVIQTDFRSVLLDVNGVGYKANLPLSDLGQLEAGQKTVLYVHTHVREDAFELFGFLKEEGMHLFELLISINGVGPRMGLAFLSGLSPNELKEAVASEDVARLTKVPGVGKKTALRIILELKDKFEKQLAQMGASAMGDKGIWNDVASALLNLGYKKALVDKAVEKTRANHEADAGLGVLLKEALKNI
tara:strand:- start:1732 stop:2316 length:585 start_codon:yes stop_codon:yes gene_type:complete